jgi:hypothetical protein
MCTTHGDCGEGACLYHACVCDPQWLQSRNHVCDYQQLRWHAAFLMSFFLGPTGADWFYLSRGQALYIFMGVFKMFAGPLLTVLVSNDAKTRLIFLVLWLVTVWLFDVVRLLLCAFPDGNGMPLY